MKQRHVIICTKHRGVFFGQTDAKEGDDPIVLTDAKMAIYWGTKKGLFELADVGPNNKSTISSVCPRIELRDITAVLEVTDTAVQAWIEA